MAGEFMSSPIFRWRVAAQYFLRESVAKPAQVVGFKGVAQVGESCSNATKLLISLHLHDLTVDLARLLSIQRSVSVCRFHVTLLIFLQASYNSGIYLRKLVLSKTFDPLPELVTGGAIIPPNP